MFGTSLMDISPITSMVRELVDTSFKQGIHIIGNSIFLLILELVMKFQKTSLKVVRSCLGTGQNLSGTRAGTIDRGAKTFFRKKLGGRDFFSKKIGRARLFFN